MSTQRQEADLSILYAGSLQGLVDDLFPSFEHATGYRCTGRGGGSRDWARQLRQGQVQADLFLSADASVNEIELMRPGEIVAEWYLVFATNELVLAYSDASPVAEEMKAVASKEGGWLQLLQAGYRLGRPDPDADPKGYRTLFALQLAEKHFGLAGLLSKVTGSPRNPKQIVDASELASMLRRGEIDLTFSYRSHAEEAGLAFVKLPEEVNLGAPSLAESYEEASYQCTDGTRYHGSPIAYTATPLVDARHASAAAAFLVFLTSDEAADGIRRHGFRTAKALVRPR